MIFVAFFAVFRFPLGVLPFVMFGGAFTGAGDRASSVGDIFLSADHAFSRRGGFLPIFALFVVVDILPIPFTRFDAVFCCYCFGGTLRAVFLQAAGDDIFFAANLAYIGAAELSRVAELLPLSVYSLAFAPSFRAAVRAIYRVRAATEAPSADRTHALSHYGFN